VDIGTLAFKQSARVPGIAVHLIGMRNPEEARRKPCRAPGKVGRKMLSRAALHCMQAIIPCSLLTLPKYMHACMSALALR
jgi:hypothetical protein